MFKYLLELVFLCVLLLFLCVFKGEWILKNFCPNLLSALIYLYNPPDQIFKPLVRIKLDVNKDGSANTLVSYRNSYYGSYVIMLQFEKENAISYAQHSTINVTSVINCRSYDGKELTMTGEKASWGYALSHYMVHDDLPLGEVQCSIELSNIPKDFVSDYGPAYIIVKKLADI